MILVPLSGCERAQISICILLYAVVIFVNTIMEKTMSKTLNRLVKKDPRIQSYHKDIDGYWVYLSDGYNWEGCGTIHEDTVKEVLEQVKYIAEGGE